jgi:hypothetical protein
LALSKSGQGVTISPATRQLQSTLRKRSLQSAGSPCVLQHGGGLVAVLLDVQDAPSRRQRWLASIAPAGELAQHLRLGQAREFALTGQYEERKVVDVQALHFLVSVSHTIHHSVSGRLRASMPSKIGRLMKPTASEFLAT